MNTIRLTALAVESRLEIWSHVALESLTAADELLDRFDEYCHRYASQPLLGEARPDFGKNVRVIPVGNYVIAYRPTGDGIEVVYFLHGARDIPTVLRRKGIS
jgi:toxin ParE1/3/4